MDLGLQDLQRADQRRRAADGQRPGLKPADGHRVGPERERLQDVAAPGDPGIEHDLRPTVDGRHHLAENVDGALAVVHLAAAVIGDIDHLDPVLDRDLGVFGGLDPLEDEGEPAMLLHRRHGVPGDPGLPFAPGLGAHAGRQPAAQELTLAAAVMRRIDGQRERRIAGIPGSPDEVADPVLVAPDIDLEDLRVVDRGRDLLEARLGDGGDQLQRAEGGRRPGDGDAAVGGDGLERPDRGEQDRDAQPMTQQRAGGVDLRDVAQHPGAERDAVERVPVSPHRRFGFGGAGDVVPDRLAHGAARGANDFMRGLVSFRHGVLRKSGPCPAFDWVEPLTVTAPATKHDPTPERRARDGRPRKRGTESDEHHS